MPSSLFSYLFAGLDFVVDTEGNPVFIEANSNPGLLFAYFQLYGRCHPLDALIPILKTIHDRVVFIVSEERFALEKEYILYRYEEFEKVFGKSHCQLLVLPAATLRQSGYLPKNSEGLDIVNSVILTPRIDLKERLAQRSDLFILNPVSVNALTVDKWKTYEVLKADLKGHMPETFLVHSEEEWKEVLLRKQWTSCVLKPRFGSKGKGVEVLFTPDQIQTFQMVPGEWLVQERISIPLQENHFWDVRAYVVNGKYVGAMKRVSKNPVVNTSKGGVVERVEPELQKKLAPLAERIVKKIDFRVKKKTVN